MTKVTFYEISEIEDACLEFAVIAARYQDKWVFCRHKQRSTWEIPGGHRALGEDIQKAVQRVLYEKIGAENAEWIPVCVYCVEKSQNVKNFGMLYWANIEDLRELLEMKEVLFSDILPKELTYPEIQTELFRRIQGWLNLQNGAGELWDVYDREKRQPPPDER